MFATARWHVVISAYTCTADSEGDNTYTLTRKSCMTVYMLRVCR